MIDDIIRPYPGEREDSFIKRKAYYIRFYRDRLEYSEGLIGNYLKNGIPITQTDKDEIDAFWSHFLKPELIERVVDYRYYNLFKRLKKDGQRLSYYIPDSFYYTYIDDYFTNPQESRSHDNKNLYDLFFHDIKRPETVFRKINGMFLESNYRIITQKEAVNKSKDEGEVVLKIGKNSNGGHGVLFWNSSVDGVDKLKDFLSSSENIVCQKVIKQHPDLSVLNPSSVNTIRLITIVFDSKVYMLSSFVRFGGKGSRVDNSHSGGLACGVDLQGRLKDPAYDLSANRYDYRPNGYQLHQIKVPSFDKCVGLVKELAPRFASVSRLISWDLSVDEKGEPILIEFELTFGGLNFHQICNGPIFGDMTENVLKEVFAKSYTLNAIIKSNQ